MQLELISSEVVRCHRCPRLRAYCREVTFVRNPNGVQLLSNVCRHRQAVMLKGRGNSRHNIVCPLHRWTYAAADPRTTGTLIGAPHFEQDPCLNLHNYPLTEWNGLLFEKSATGKGRDVWEMVVENIP